MAEEIKLEPAVAPTATSTAASSVADEDSSCSDGDGSDAESTVVAYVAKTPRRRRQKQPRRTDLFCIARPPPRLVKKRLMQQIRPKLLLQLHQISKDRRPTPVLDVFPAATIASSVVGGRLAVRFPRVFGVGRKGGSELGSQDVILFRSEEYCSTSSCHSTADVPTDDGSLSRRDLVAVLSPLRREDRTEIVLSDGQVWTAEQLASGSFEFRHTDEDGTVRAARWVRRSSSKPMSPSSLSVQESGGYCSADLSSPTSLFNARLTSPDEYKYTFSVLDPTKRRHPVMASLTRDALDINETYTTISSIDPLLINKGEYGEDESENELIAPPAIERRTFHVDASLRSLISITALWVTLRLDGVMPSVESTRNQVPSRSRSGSVTSQPISASSLPNQHRKVNSTPIAPKSTDPQCQSDMLPRRATSTGAAYMQRRIQMSDASDSERSGGRIRVKARRVLSGDFSWRRVSLNAVVTDPEHEASTTVRPSSIDGKAPESWAVVPSAKHTRQESGQTVIISTMEGEFQHGSRSVQAITDQATPSVKLPDADETEHDHHNADLAGLASLTTKTETTPPPTGEEHAAAKGWKKFTKWIRRLGP